MKLVNIKYFEQININDDIPTVLTIENPLLFRNIILSFHQQIKYSEGDNVLSIGSNILDFSKKTLLITDIFHIGESTRQLKTQLNQSIIKNIRNTDEQYKLINGIHQFANEIIADFDYPITYKDDMTISDLIKLCDFDFSFDAENYLELMIDTIKTTYSFLKYELVIITNLLDSISEEECEQFIKMISYQHIPVLLIERHQTNYLNSKIKQYIIDSDLCII